MAENGTLANLSTSSSAVMESKQQSSDGVLDENSMCSKEVVDSVFIGAALDNDAVDIASADSMEATTDNGQIGAVIDSDSSGATADNNPIDITSDGDTVGGNDEKDDDLVLVSFTSGSREYVEISDTEVAIEDEDQLESCSNASNSQSDGHDSDEEFARMLQEQELAFARTTGILDDRFAAVGMNDQGMISLAGFFEQEEESEFEESEQEDLSYEALLELQERIGEVKKRGLSPEQLVLLKAHPAEADGDCVVCMCPIKTAATSGDEDALDNVHLGKRSLVERGEREADLVVSLPECKHVFHQECVYSWLQRRETCPICRIVVQVDL